MDQLHNSMCHFCAFWICKMEDARLIYYFQITFKTSVGNNTQVATNEDNKHVFDRAVSASSKTTKVKWLQCCSPINIWYFIKI